MAQLAIPVAGAVFGSAIGIGAAAGWVIGATVGTLLFPPGVPDGPRLGDLTVTSSAYGTPIGLLAGKIRVTCSLGWALEIKEVRTKEKVGKGGQKQTVYKYFLCGAYFGGEPLIKGQVASLMQMWANGKTIYDATVPEVNDFLNLTDEEKIDIYLRSRFGGGTDLGQLTFEEIADEAGLDPSDYSSPLSFGVAATLALQGDADSKLNFRFYGGARRQTPDPMIEADVGVGRTPGYNNQIYVALEDLPLEDHGNAPPQISMVVAFDGTPTIVVVPTSFVTGGSTNTDDEKLHWDFRRNIIWAAEGSGSINQIKIDALRMQEIDDIDSGMNPVTEAVYNPHFWSGDFIITNGAANSDPVRRWDAATESAAEQWGNTGILLGNSSTRFENIDRSLGIRTLNNEFWVTIASLTGDIGLLSVPLDYVWHNGAGIDNARMFLGTQLGSFADAFIVNSGGTAIHRLRVQDYAEFKDGEHIGVEYTTSLYTIPDGTFRQAVFDPSDDTHILMITGGTGGDRVQKVDLEDGTIIWETPTTIFNGFDRQHVKSRISNNRYVYQEGNTLYMVNTVDGTVSTQTLVGVDNWVTNSFGAQIYDGDTNSLVVVTGFGEGVLRISPGFISGSGVRLGDVVQALCERVGYDPATDLDTTELNDIIPGYLLGRQTRLRDALEPLAFGYSFTSVEIDYKIHFPKRSRAKTVDIPSTDFLAPSSQDEDALVETRVLEEELPRTWETAHLDPERDYDFGLQSHSRNLNPDPTMGSSEIARLNMPVAITPQFAKEISVTKLYEAWIERMGQKVRLPVKYVGLNPSDIIGLNHPNTNRDCRIIRAAYDVNRTISIDSLAFDAQVLVPFVQTDGGIKLPQRIPTPNDSELFVLDTPLIFDVDDSGATGLVTYFAMGGFGLPNWDGGILYKSDDGTEFLELDSSNAEMTWGVAQDLLGDTPLPNNTDNTNTVTIRLSAGSASDFGSITALQMYNGQNAAIIGKKGRFEIFQFQNVTINDNGTITLSTLLRGRRATRHNIGLHEAGDYFIFLDSAIKRFVIPTSDLNNKRFYKGVGFGQFIEQAIAKECTSLGNAERPVQVSQLRSTLQANGDIITNWVRGTRIGASWQDGFGVVPLSENREEYLVEYVDIDSDIAVRSRQVIDATTDTYTDAEQEADGFKRDLVTDVNLDFDEGTSNGWTVDAGTMFFTTSNAGQFPSSDGGIYILTASTELMIRRDVDIEALVSTTDIDNGDTYLNINAYRGDADTVDEESGDTGRFWIEARDDLGVLIPNEDPLLDTGFEGSAEMGRGIWVTRGGQNIPIPANTRLLRINWNSLNGDGGAGSTAALDRITMSISHPSGTFQGNKRRVSQISEQVNKGVPTETEILYTIL